ncbi:MAG: signal peptidase I [Ruminococcaceae bacterium]|nr:signal peptidase I [Oscillospiraceae bacterium]
MGRCIILRKKEDAKIYFDEIENSYAKNAKVWRFIYSWLDTLIFAIVAIAIIFTFLFRFVTVNGKSMTPTLHNGDCLSVSAIRTHYERGDIIVITQPNQLNEPLIKRVIAVGGDTVDINFADGTVKVNGERLNESYIAEPTNRMFDVAFPVTVPEGCVFVMGDNRNDSLDSRSTIVGMIDERYVLGKAGIRIFPLGDWKIN